MTEAETIANAVNEMLRQMAVDRDRIEELEAALLEIFDHECRASSKSFIACTAREALWPNAVLGEKKDD